MRVQGGGIESMTGRIENKAYLGAVRQVQELKIWNNDRIGQEGIGQMDYVNAFWVGGLVCALVQILMEKTKMLPGRIMVLLVCTGAVLGALQLYEPFQEFAGAGASVPLLGFGNTLWKGVKEAVESDGFIGIFMGGFKASAVGI